MTIAGILPTILFSFTGYVANAVQNEATLTVIKALNSLVPAVILIIGILVYTRYSLTEKRFDEIVEELTRRRMAAKQAEDRAATQQRNKNKEAKRNESGMRY